MVEPVNATDKLKAVTKKLGVIIKGQEIIKKEKEQPKPVPYTKISSKA
jgi:hypothetical protein